MTPPTFCRNPTGFRVKTDVCEVHALRVSVISNALIEKPCPEWATLVLSFYGFFI